MGSFVWQDSQCFWNDASNALKSAAQKSIVYPFDIEKNKSQHNPRKCLIVALADPRTSGPPPREQTTLVHSKLARLPCNKCSWFCITKSTMKFLIALLQRICRHTPHEQYIATTVTNTMPRTSRIEKQLIWTTCENTLTKSWLVTCVSQSYFWTRQEID